MTKKWSERDLIRMIGEINDEKHPDLVLGAGDDCAIFKTDPEYQTIVSTDMLVENIHFNLSWHPPYLLGRKCAAVNLSDIAAMGGTPVFALVSIALPQEVENPWLRDWASGFISMLSMFDCTLIGGDTVQGAHLSINVTIIGKVLKNRAILRKTAGADENIYVTGVLGSAAAGLQLLTNSFHENTQATEKFNKLISRHLDPTPDIQIGRILAGSGVVTAMQDISDGLATDLAHICQQSRVGAFIDAELLPADEALQEAALLLGSDLCALQISGGEDYHLVFTVEQGKDKILQEKLSQEGIESVFRIGKTTSDSPGVVLRTEKGEREISFQGFEH